MLSRINEALISIWTRLQDEDGQALAEYGLILGLIAVICIAVLGALGLAISGHLGSLTSAMGGGGS